MSCLLHSLQLKALLLHSFVLFHASSFSWCLSPTNPTLSPHANLTTDFGRIIYNYPNEAFQPQSPQDISQLLKSISSSPNRNNVTVAARGVGHSTYGQAQALNGIVIGMRSLTPYIQIGEAQLVASKNSTFYVDAGGGALWIEVLKETMKHGLTPRSWTDYLYLTVGGTLSNAGISGQAYKYGPQIANVMEVDVVTGKGDIVTCSEMENSDLFYGVLGGLGQFGIITRARIVLEPAPRRVKWARVPYDDFNQFTADEEQLIKLGDVNYLEGFITFKDNSPSNVYYTLEFAIYYNDEGDAQKTLDRVLSQLNFSMSMPNITDVSYFDFLNRVKAEEESLRKKGLWEVPHPWLTLFVPRNQIGRFKDLLLRTTLEANTPIAGPIIIYPTLKDKWNQNMSAVLPQANSEENVFYAVSVLRSSPPSCTPGSPCLESFLNQNQKIIEVATAEPTTNKATATVDATARKTKTPMSHPRAEIIQKTESMRMEVRTEAGDEGGMGAKQYLPYYKDQNGWRLHFGEKWGRFEELKSRFDPLNILAPGQRIFQRKPLEG
ncbi:cytokinin dehydrogenase 7-like [Phoenix dactylifera]|uniref:cytokinin dehydrogenase n=1 Tax=Phoenix dactylifera TaxID=42345 RepID=A0A8B9A2T8_PHODC|nr:cytokinin dehydrogenase 7-like [Phoenix dactylifera]